MAMPKQKKCQRCGNSAWTLGNTTIDGKMVHCCLDCLREVDHRYKPITYEGK